MLRIINKASRNMLEKAKDEIVCPKREMQAGVRVLFVCSTVLTSVE